MNNTTSPNSRPEAKWLNVLLAAFPVCSDSACRLRRWRIPWRRTGFRFHGAWYCTPECFETALTRHYRVIQPETAGRDRPAHRIPLGLMLLEKGLFSNAQLRAALHAQESSGGGRIGEWLVRMGATTEEKVTAALAQQWGCAVYPLTPSLELRWAAMVPVPILESFRVIPLHYIPSTRTLLVGFCDGVDHSLLYGIEQMLDCRAEPCLLPSSAMLRFLDRIRQQGRPDEVVFERVSDPAELACITLGYVVKLNAANVRIVRCGEQIWVRLQCPAEAMNLIFRCGPPSCQNQPDVWPAQAYLRATLPGEHIV